MGKRLNKLNKMDLNELLELRKRLKKKKPDFVRQDFHKKRLSGRWKKPRGLHSKVRLGLRGKPKGISRGYSSPKKVRSFDKHGLKPVLVASLKGIERIKKESEGAVIKSSVGLKKRYEILKRLKECRPERSWR